MLIYQENLLYFCFFKPRSHYTKKGYVFQHFLTPGIRISENTGKKVRVLP